MKNTIKILTLLAFVISITFSSCSSNNDDDIFEQQELSEVVMKDFVQNFENLKVPEGLSSSNNNYAQQANSQFEVLKALGISFTSLFVIPGNAISSKSTQKENAKSAILNTQTYTWSSDGVTINYTISEESDRYTFNYSIASLDFTGKLMAGFQLKDGSYAEVSLFDDGQTISTIKWWVSANTTKIALDSDGFKLELESNTADNSGTLKVFDDNFLAALYQWNADGSGTYTDYYSNQSYSW